MPLHGDNLWPFGLAVAQPAPLLPDLEWFVRFARSIAQKRLRIRNFVIREEARHFCRFKICSSSILSLRNVPDRAMSIAGWIHWAATSAER